MMEETPFKKIFRVPMEDSGMLLQKMMEYHPTDVMVEEEEIGSVVERIYAEIGAESNQLGETKSSAGNRNSGIEISGLPVTGSGKGMEGSVM